MKSTLAALKGASAQPKATSWRRGDGAAPAAAPAAPGVSAGEPHPFACLLASCGCSKPQPTCPAAAPAAPGVSAGEPHLCGCVLLQRADLIRNTQQQVPDNLATAGPGQSHNSRSLSISKRPPVGLRACIVRLLQASSAPLACSAVPLSVSPLIVAREATALTSASPCTSTAATDRCARSNCADRRLAVHLQPCAEPQRSPSG